ncbi:hypothetical protein EVAR_38673_1 [Eumeta japonica]|uniref:Uncharacterized protein n=1 Tax=Eumeta variegata TaxID=151549 RepID=A0A4C1YAP1_EUMVA|nr:hypothetical protein EVAR_38673_1 [Eumeta japonica]
MYDSNASGRARLELTAGLFRERSGARSTRTYHPPVARSLSHQKRITGISPKSRTPNLFFSLVCNNALAYKTPKMGIVFSRSTALRDEVTSEMTDESETVSGTSTCSESASEENPTDKSHKREARTREMIAFKEQLAIKREQRRAILARHRAEKESLKKCLENEQKARRDLSEENKLLRELLMKHDIDIDLSYREKEEVSIHDTIKSMREEFDVLRENNKRLRKELAESNLSLQQTNTDLTSLQCQNIEFTKQISALKEVITVSKTMIKLREQQLNEPLKTIFPYLQAYKDHCHRVVHAGHGPPSSAVRSRRSPLRRPLLLSCQLKEKLNQIEQSLADKEANLLSTDLRQEYERQLQNIRTLRTLYEERARLAEVTRLNLVRELEEQKSLNAAEINKSKSLENSVTELELKVSDLNSLLEQKDEVINTCQNEATELKTEMSAINTLFSQVLLGFKNDQNLDTLIHRLKEHQGILTHMAKRENGSETSSALPRVLLQLVSQIEDSSAKIDIDYEDPLVPNTTKRQEIINENSEDKSSPVNIAPEEIVKNLPKVWRVLMELLCHQNDANTTETPATCFKSVETTTGPVLVPSVSQTYIRLKDLIVEKLALMKEMNKMKQLNSHLETRLQEQERRLCLVTSELSKTWHVVGRLRRHHHQLHTHEKILKYELQQKRKLLNELKEELAYCREKLEKAREKNSQSERDWRKLRADFSSRRVKGSSPLNNSGESGYSDERQSDTSESNDESEYVNEPPIKCKIKLRSFDILDFSTEAYLVAEREDPISDLTDVVDLPLDGQEAEDNIEPRSSTSQNDTEDMAVSESSANIEKCEKINENGHKVLDVPKQEDIEENNSEKEYDTCAVNKGIDCETSLYHSNDQNISEKSVLSSNLKEGGSCIQNMKPSTSSNNEYESNNTKKQTEDIISKINPAAILENIKRQNEMLAKKDAKLQNLERNSTMLLEQAQSTINLSEQLNSTLDHILSRPGTSVQSSQSKINEKKSNDLNTTMSLHGDCISEQQYITLTENEDRFNKSDCNVLTGTVDEETNSVDNSSSTCNETSKSDDSPEPSTSKQDIDHEARFAAREERLKRLEEQTKSLVSKVNNTTTKRIKLKYKLEELHNIYGSENSRDGTPSGETEDDETIDDSTGHTEEENNK